MDILETEDSSGCNGVVVVKEEVLELRDKRKASRKRSGSPDGDLRLIDDHPVKYAVQQDESGGAVAYRVVQLSPELPPSPSTSPTLYNSISPGCTMSIEVYPVAPGQKPVAPAPIRIQSSDDISRPVYSSRDDRRRATHNEVERRRRDKINNWIIKLGKIIPECNAEPRKGAFESQSKGFILSKACDYITELKEMNEQLGVALKQQEQVCSELEATSRKLDDLAQENRLLRAALAHHGLPLPQAR